MTVYSFSVNGMVGNKYVRHFHEFTRASKLFLSRLFWQQKKDERQKPIFSLSPTFFVNENSLARKKSNNPQTLKRKDLCGLDENRADCLPFFPRVIDVDCLYFFHVCGSAAPIPVRTEPVKMRSEGEKKVSLQ